DATSTDAAGNTSSSPNSLLLVIDTTPPVVSAVSTDPSVFSPTGDNIQDITTIKYTLSEDVFVTLSVLDGQGNTVRSLVIDLLQAAGSGWSVWDGPDEFGSVAPDGSYTVTVDAVDPAGNAAVEQQVGVTVYTTAPVLSNVGVVPAAISPNGDG